MPLFQCVKCGCIENTAVCNYWINKHKEKPLDCSECDKSIGKWHGMFEKKSAEGMLIAQDGTLHYKDENLSPCYKIVGEVAASPTQSMKDE